VTRDIDESSENVLSDWSSRTAGDPAADDDETPFDGAPSDAGGDSSDVAREQPPQRALEDTQLAPPAADPWAPEPEAGAGEVVEAEPGVEEPRVEEPGVEEPRVEEPGVEEPGAEDPGADAAEDEHATPMSVTTSHEHAVGELEIPDGYAVLEGDADGARRAVGVVISRFNGGVTTRLLERALDELDEAGVSRDAITIMVVPGAFELPLAATALAKTRRFACIVALGCVIRGDTPHFDYVAGETASGLQLAALETGVPVSFGVLTLDRVEQADGRIEKGAEAVRTALEMADVFSHLRAAATR
jgi:6,7-dimethyl-8-ribityllumazine synthase